MTTTTTVVGVEKLKLISRAVERQIEAGNDVDCVWCGEHLKFNAKHKTTERRQVIANIYWRGKWQRVEHWHTFCYKKAGKPYGIPTTIEKRYGKPTGKGQRRQIIAKR